jgi:hypothetical protein
LRRGLAAQTREITTKAEQRGQPNVGNALTMLARTTEGRRTFCSIRELAAQIIIQRREVPARTASEKAVRFLKDGIRAQKASKRK